MSKKFIKGLILVMTMIVLCFAVTSSAVGLCSHPGNEQFTEAGSGFNCELGGTVFFNCWTCGFAGEGYLAPREHMMDGYTVEATCTEDGYASWFCISCDYGAYTEVIPALGHEYSGEWVELLPATCYDRGVKINQCTRCNKVVSEIIDRLPHTDTDADAICDECSTLLSATVTPENPDTPDAPDDPDTSEIPETPEQPKEEANIFSFLTHFLTSLLDFFSKLFKLN